MLSCVFASLLVASFCLAFQPDHILRIQTANVSSDCFIRESVTINGTSPGPILRIKEGTRVWIRVFNDLKDQNTTLHMHGLTQYMSPWADGTMQTSQWPIPPGGFFDYEFQPQVGSAGTYYAHSHVGYQPSTAYLPLIIEDAGPLPYLYDEKLVISIADYWHLSDQNITSGLMANPLIWMGEPDSFSINGHSASNCNSTTEICNDKCHSEVVYIKPDTTYRMRVIGALALSYIYMAIEGHSNLQLIEVDGGYVQPVNISHLEIGSGQRYSMLFKTKPLEELAQLNQSQFWSRLELEWDPDRVFGQFIFQYLPSKSSSTPSTLPVDAYKAPPSDLVSRIFLPTESLFWVLDKLQPFNTSSRPPPDSEVSRRIYVDARVPTLGMGYTVNGYSYKESLPHIPYLIQAYSPEGFHPNHTLALANQGFDSSTNTFPIELGETVDYLVTNAAEDSGIWFLHQWHLHGSHPWLIAQGLGQFSEVAYAKARERMAAAGGKPIRRDTPTIFSTYNGSAISNQTVAFGSIGGWFVMRLKAEDAGVFLMHCHLLSHSLLGMGTVQAIGIESLPPLPANFTRQYMNYSTLQDTEPTSYFDLIDKPPRYLTLNKCFCAPLLLQTEWNSKYATSALPISQEWGNATGDTLMKWRSKVFM